MCQLFLSVESFVYIYIVSVSSYLIMYCKM
jgi:hypothetical protein